MSQSPKNIPAGAYWYLVPGKPPTICEKRDGEDFIRFTNCSRQSWIREGDSLVGPLPVPTNDHGPSIAP